jgi:lysozyme family protein
LDAGDAIGDAKTMDNFDKCLDMLLKHEGGFVDHPDDPGGMTNLGVTKKTYDAFFGTDISEEEMRALTKADVSSLYEERYWNKCKCSELPSGVDWAVFDWAVNSGPSRAAKSLQRAVGAFEDGSIGPMTLQAVKADNTVNILEAMACDREAFYRALKHFPTFGRGWLRRNEETLQQALEMAL